MKKGYRLSLDEMFKDSYYYTEYDRCRYGHEIIILAEDKEKFLDAFAAEWRKRAEEALEEVAIKKHKGEYDVVEVEQE